LIYLSLYWRRQAVLEGLVLATQSTSTSALLALTGILNFHFFLKTKLVEFGDLLIANGGFGLFDWWV
jgi:hypothetical protein